MGCLIPAGRWPFAAVGPVVVPKHDSQCAAAELLGLVVCVVTLCFAASPSLACSALAYARPPIAKVPGALLLAAASAASSEAEPPEPLSPLPDGGLTSDFYRHYCSCRWP